MVFNVKVCGKDLRLPSQEIPLQGTEQRSWHSQAEELSAYWMLQTPVLSQIAAQAGARSERISEFRSSVCFPDY